MKTPDTRDLLAASLASGHFPVPVQDWDEFMRLAAYEAVLPALFSSIKTQLPTEIAEPLEAVSLLNLERNEHILNQAHEVIRRLNDAGIEPVALKGLALLFAGVFPDPAVRYLCDVDFLIPEHQLATAIEVLAQAGYTPDVSDALAKFRHHAPQMQRLGFIPVELHRSIGLGLPGQILPALELLAASRPIDFKGARLRIPSPEHLVTHLILHSQVRHPYRERIWPPLRAMYDLVSLNRRFAADLNWPSIERAFRSGGQLATLQLHLLQVEQTLGMPRPIPIRLTPLTRLRWMRRRLLTRYPALRLIDPSYVLMSTLSRRYRLLRSIFSVPGGWQQVLQMLLTRGFYQRLFSEFTLAESTPEPEQTLRTRT